MNQVQWRFVAFTALCMALAIRLAETKSYYLDVSAAANGKGTRASPWNEVASVNEFNAPKGFSPGDIIYIKRGTTVTGTPVNRWEKGGGAELKGLVSPRGSGNAAAGPIAIDAYGRGAAPVIDAGGAKNTAAILLYNQDFWTINNIKVTTAVAMPDSTGASQGYRWGIFAHWDDGDTVRKPTLGGPHGAITIKNCIVEDVYGAYCNDPSSVAPLDTPCGPFGNATVWVHVIGGIYIKADDPTRVDKILIEGNRIKNITGAGILISGEWPWTVTADPSKWNNLSTNVVIRGNTISTTCDGIQPNGVRDILVEYNTVDNAGGTAVMDPHSNNPKKRDPTRYSEGVGGIWTTTCDGGLIQHNEIRRTRMVPGDGQALNSDLCSKGAIVFQYNFTHDNEGGFFMSCRCPKHPDAPGAKTVVRFNISRNDGNCGGPGIWVPTTMYLYKGNMEIYNNVLYLSGPNAKFRIFNPEGERGLNDCTFSNNIFHGNSASDFGPFMYVRNSFWGGCQKSLPAKNSEAVTADPKFVGAGTGGDGFGAARGYKLKPGSPCIGAGRKIEGAGSRSFGGAGLYNGKPDIGAYEE